MINKEPDKFWQSWRNLNKPKVSQVSRVDGFTGESDNAASFASNFSSVYTNNDHDSHSKLESESRVEFMSYFTKHIHDSLSAYLLTWDDMLSIVGKLKPDKCYSGNFKAEHISKEAPELMVHLHILFNSMLQHGFLVSDLLRGSPGEDGRI
jgi:hypothetical protein